MHHLLKRQLKKTLSADLQSSPELEGLLKTVSDTYENYDNDRNFLERSFDLSSKEFALLHEKVVTLLEELRIEKETVEQKIIERTKELTFANERLTELDKVKTEFISVAAHQLRTPLTAIKWIFSLLTDEDSANLTTEQRGLIMKGNESNERMIALINDMLAVTRIESGKVQYHFKLIHIEELIDSVILDFTGLAHKRNVNLSFEKPPTQLPYINADQEKIRSVIQNLIENAITYTKDGGHVVLRAEREQDILKVSIQDDGIGIPKQQQSSIFNKYFRADNATRVQTDGSGLGLFITKKAIEKHGGTINFKSILDKGSIFYFTLPLANVDAISSSSTVDSKSEL
ncbi:MAG TPA: HAMP domain-containing sensor histidine kinase [Candidatus Andersenbacteria bacterium]|nr:HAMP domain-containing sensor histidine kinase [Candidatus Andersenbacteria bacterium]